MEAIDIPEIRHYVGQHLNKAGLIAAAAVCKSWNATFTSFLYSTVSWQATGLTREDKKKLAVFRKHANYVRNMTLKFDSNTGDDFAALGQFMQLEQVYMDFTSLSFDQFWKWTTTFLAQNPRLNSLKVCFRSYYGMDPIPSGFFEASLKSFWRLKMIHLFQGLYHFQDLGLLLRETSETLEELDLNAISIRDLTASETAEGDTLAYLHLPHEFPNLKILSLRDRASMSLQLALVERRPQLRSLKWTLPEWMYVATTTKLTRILKQRCSLIVELELSNLPLRDREIAEVLEGTQPGLVTILFGRSKFGPLALEPLLRQHAVSLTKILLYSKTSTVTSAMIQKILTTCHQLMEFGADRLNARDILGLTEIDTEDDEDEDEDEEEEEGKKKKEGRDWVCTKLRFFEMFICGLRDKPLSWHRGVFKQISRLERLEELYVGACSSIKEETPPRIFRTKTIWDGLDMRLEAGLDSLSSLKQLVDLGFDSTKQELEEKDVQWMVKSRPNLVSVFGELNTKRSKFVKLGAILEVRGISTSVDDEPDSDDEEQDFNFNIFDTFMFYW
ncbi:hypothetical protein BGX26_005717 [Mortierella sp. AD094]|nr:hypothetical protein BGX26_005717 [Mortierella sp. AD094]